MATGLVLEVKTMLWGNWVGVAVVWGFFWLLFSWRCHTAGPRALRAKAVKWPTLARLVVSKPHCLLSGGPGGTSCAFHQFIVRDEHLNRFRDQCVTLPIISWLRCEVDVWVWLMFRWFLMLNWIELNWVELNSIELNWFELNWVELSCECRVSLSCDVSKVFEV